MECVRLSAAKGRALNPEKHRATVSAWRARNPDQAKEIIRVWRASHKEHRAASYQEWKAANPGSNRLRKAVRRARKKAAGGSFTVAEIRDLLVKQNGRCGYCRTSIKNGYHVDHITPLARGGTNWIRNIQLLCASCNHRKYAKDPVEFAREIGLLL